MRSVSPAPNCNPGAKDFVRAIHPILAHGIAAGIIDILQQQTNPRSNTERPSAEWFLEGGSGLRV